MPAVVLPPHNTAHRIKLPDIVPRFSKNQWGGKRHVLLHTSFFARPLASRGISKSENARPWARMFRVRGTMPPDSKQRQSPQLSGKRFANVSSTDSLHVQKNKTSAPAQVWTPRRRPPALRSPEQRQCLLHLRHRRRRRRPPRPCLRRRPLLGGPHRTPPKPDLWPTRKASRSEQREVKEAKDATKKQGNGCVFLGPASSTERCSRRGCAEAKGWLVYVRGHRKQRLGRFGAIGGAGVSRRLCVVERNSFPRSLWSPD